MFGYYEWLQWPAIIIALAILIVSIRIAFTFNIVEWLKYRRECRDFKNQDKASQECFHLWDVYRGFSKCAQCQVYIGTSALNAHVEFCGCNPVVVSSDPFSRLKPQGRVLTLRSPHNKSTFRT